MAGLREIKNILTRLISVQTEPDSPVFYYEDEYITANLKLEYENNPEDGVIILDWQTTGKTIGGSVKSLEKLRLKYGEVRAVDCGYPHEPRFKYWARMLQEGFIWAFTDDNGKFYTNWE